MAFVCSLTVNDGDSFPERARMAWSVTESMCSEGKCQEEKEQKKKKGKVDFSEFETTVSCSEQ